MRLSLLRMMIFAVALGGAVPPAMADTPRQFECTAKASGMAQRLRLTVADGEVEAFDYSSVDLATACACGVVASKAARIAGTGSAWMAQPDGSMRVDLSLETSDTGTERSLGTAVIRNDAGQYTLTVTPAPRADFCAAGAYLAPVVALTVGSAQCRLGEAASAGLIAGSEQTIALAGRLRQQREWGPPGYGESPAMDTTFTAWIMDLPRPVAMQAGGDYGKPHEVTLKSIQLLGELSSSGGWKKMTGKLVLASGKLWTANTGGQVTPVYLDVSDLRLKADER